MRGAQRRPGAQQGLPARAPPRCAAPRSSTRRSTAPTRTTSPSWSASIGKVTAALNVHEQQLGELIGNFNTFFAAFAAQSRAAAPRPSPSCRARCSSIDRGLAALDASLPPDAGLRARHPPRRQADARDGHGGAALDRTGAGLARAERARRRRQGPRRRRSPPLAEARGRTGPALPADRTVQQVPDERDLSRPATPSSRTAQRPSGVENYKEFWYCLVGLAGHRPELRRQRRRSTKFLVGNSGQTLRSQPTSIARRQPDRAAAARALAADAARHAPGATRPKSRPTSRWCPATRRRCPTSTARSRRARPTGAAMDGRPTAAGHEGGLSVRDQIERYRTAFIAVVTMIVIAAAVGGYILAHENLKLPGWVPVLGPQLLHAQGRIPDRPGGHPGPGPGGHDRRRQDRRNRERRPARRAWRS